MGNCSKHLDHSLLLSLKQRKEKGRQGRKFSSGLSQSLKQPPKLHPYPTPTSRPWFPRHQLVMCSASEAETGSCWPLVLTINTMTEKQVSELRAGTETATSLSALGEQEAGDTLAICKVQGTTARTGC